MIESLDGVTVILLMNKRNQYPFCKAVVLTDINTKQLNSMIGVKKDRIRGLASITVQFDIECSLSRL